MYLSAYSKIEFHPEDNILLVLWLEASKDLNEEGVKTEISKILYFLDQHQVENVVVDSTSYPFRNTISIQNWINHKFMPQIMESSVKKYAIVVRPEIINQFDNFEDEDDEILVVRYFPNIDGAYKWIKNKKQK
jgi:hypothetical protein